MASPPVPAVVQPKNSLEEIVEDIILFPPPETAEPPPALTTEEIFLPPPVTVLTLFVPEETLDETVLSIVTLPDMTMFTPAFENL